MMETTQLYQGLTFLSYATGVIVILVGCMLVKVLFDISKLTQNINETTTIVKTDEYNLINNQICRKTRSIKSNNRYDCLQTNKHNLYLFIY